LGGLYLPSGSRPQRHLSGHPGFAPGPPNRPGIHQQSAGHLSGRPNGRGRKRRGLPRVPDWMDNCGPTVLGASETMMDWVRGSFSLFACNRPARSLSLGPSPSPLAKPTAYVQRAWRSLWRKSMRSRPKRLSRSLDSGDRFRESGDIIPISDFTSGCGSKSGTSNLVGFGPGFGDYAKGRNLRACPGSGTECGSFHRAPEFRPTLRLQYHRNAVPNLFPLGAYRHVAICPKYLLPKVRLEPTPSCEDRILSPVLLPYS
jgi:hypothetical protein